MLGMALACAIAVSSAIEAPPALQHGLAISVPGDVVDITSIASSPTPPNWPTLVASRTFSENVTMVFSGSPERVPGPGIAYADTLPIGKARIMIYHVNASTDSGNTPQNMKFSIVLEPLDAAHPATVTIHRKSVHAYPEGYFTVGVNCAYDYFSQADQSITIQVNGPTLLDPGLETHTIPKSTSLPLIEGLYDFDVSGNPVKFSDVALSPTANTLATYKSLQPLAREVWEPGTANAGSFKHDRGTYPADANKLVSNAAAYNTASGCQHVRIASGIADAYGPDAFAGEGTPPGVDALTSPPIASTLRGNFGCVYTLGLKLASTDGRRVAIVVNPRGGAIAGAHTISASLTGSGVFYCPQFPISPPNPASSPLLAAVIGRWDPARTPNITIQWSPAGATSMPVEFLAIPYSEPGDVNGDGTVDISDAVAVIRFANHLATPTSHQLVAGDVAPYDAPDGVLTVGDAAWILRKAGGLL